MDYKKEYKKVKRELDIIEGISLAMFIAGILVYGIMR